MEYILGNNEHFTITKNDGSINVDELSSEISTLEDFVDSEFESTAAILNVLNENISIKNITYSALKTLRDNSQLVPGSWYRITDYVTTTVSTNTQSAGHQFDIIVRAAEVNKLNENAYAAKHAGDTYFANSNLEAWELKYSLDNDTNRFAWADSTNGNGVIYYMKDEFGNECAYDFKNMMFLRYKTTSTSGAFYNNMYFGMEWKGTYYPEGATIDTSDTKYLYTFTAYESGYVNISDATLNSGSEVTCYENVIKSYYVQINSSGEAVGYTLNNIVFQGLSILRCNHNSFGKDCYYNSFGNYCHYNSFGKDCCYNSFGNYYNNNSFGRDCWYNSFGSGCNNNSFGSGCNNNSFGNDCYYNSFGSGCNHNSFGSGCNNNSFGSGCYYNSFGSGCNHNSFGNSCYENSFWNDCYYNSFGSGCNSNSFGNSCMANSFGNSCKFNSFVDNCSSNSFGNNCYENSFDKYYTWNIIIEGCNQRITLSSTQTTSSASILRNIKITQGVNNSNQRLTISHDTLNDKYQTVYRAQDSQDVYLNSQGYY